MAGKLLTRLIRRKTGVRKQRNLFPSSSSQSFGSSIPTVVIVWIGRLVGRALTFALATLLSLLVVLLVGYLTLVEWYPATLNVLVGIIKIAREMLKLRFF